MLKLCHSTYEVTDAQHALYFASDLVPTLLGIHYLLVTWITWHGLSTWHMSDSTLITNWHGLIFTCCAWHVLLVWHELSKWLKCVDTHLSKPIWDQKSPPLTWVSKTLGHALISLSLRAQHISYLSYVQNFKISKFCNNLYTSKFDNSP